MIRKLRRVLSGIERETRLVREIQPRVGLHRAVAQRLVANLELDGITDRLDALERVGADTVDPRFDLNEFHRRLMRLELHDRVAACEAWLACEPPSATLITVVMATRNRADLALEAIGSVQAQTHPNWELVVIDDGSTDQTPAVLATLNDPRIRVLLGGGKGAASARNLGLDEAKGAAVAYLDDDNAMLPGWLAAVAWAFDRYADVEVLYGALVVEQIWDWDPVPALHFEPFDPGALRQRNLIDTNALAHRRGLSEARWSPDAPSPDWELALRLTAQRPAMALPVRAAFYRTSAPGRLTNDPQVASSLAAFRERLQQQQ
jgi:hypothetical protein